ncbi:MAG TPA: VOC family protein [Chloroflexota bacterium]|jgi:catechol 2,3-dioxygenase-like lactoylglutathione lyase family enzyme|nr:VOC family protein [Chloroflexota bacterium]
MIDVKPSQQAASSENVETMPIKVRKLGHAVLVVNDIERTTRFWTEIMGFKVSDRNEQGMVFLRYGGDHHTIGLAEAKEKGPLPGRDRAGLSHLAFEVGSMDELFHIRDFLKKKGVKITFEGRKGPGSNPGVEFLDPDGYGIELYAYMDQIGWDGKSRPPEQWHRVSSLEEVVANPLP